MIDWSMELDFGNKKAIEQSLKSENEYVNINSRQETFDFENIPFYIKQLLESKFRGSYILDENKWDDFFNCIVPTEEIAAYCNFYRNDKDILHQLILGGKIRIEKYYPDCSPSTVEYLYQEDNFIYKDTDFNAFIDKIIPINTVKKLISEERIKISKPPAQLKYFLYGYYNSIFKELPLLVDFWKIDASFILAWIFHTYNKKPCIINVNSENLAYNALLNSENDLVNEINKVKKVNSPVLNYILNTVEFTKDSVGIKQINFANDECVELKLLLLFYPSLCNWFKPQKSKKEFSIKKIQQITKKMQVTEDNICKLNYYLFEVLFGYNYCLELCNIRQEFKIRFNDDLNIMKRIDLLIEKLIPLANITTRIIFVKKITEPILVFASDPSIVEILDNIIDILPDKVSLYNDIFQWIIKNILVDFEYYESSYQNTECYESFVKDFNYNCSHLAFMKEWNDFTFVNYEDTQDKDIFNYYKEIQQKYITLNYIK